MMTFILALVMHAHSALAETNPVFQPCIHAKNQIEIVKYDPVKNVYLVTWDRIKASESKLYATPENLVKAVHSLSMDSIRRNPGGLVGNIYSTDEDLDLVILATHVAAKPRATAKPAAKPTSSRMPASVQPHR